MPAIWKSSSILTFNQWNPERPHSVFTLQASQSCVYQAAFSPHQPDLIACAAADGLLRLFDLRAPNLLNAPTSLTSPVSTPALIVPPRGPGELLSLDWNKYRPYVLATGGTDKAIRIWDCRMVKPNAGVPVANDAPVVGATYETEFMGHEYAVRKVQWCPHRADLLVSASYDMTCRMYVHHFVNSTIGISLILMFIQDGVRIHLKDGLLSCKYLMRIPSL